MINIRKISPFISIGILDLFAFSQNSLTLQKRERERAGSQFLLRQMLKTDDFELSYHPTNKPFLKGMKEHISISHSHEFSTIVFSGKNIGIDIEKMRSKTANIATKFCKSELNFLDASLSDYIKKLTVIWAAKKPFLKSKMKKESVLKIISKF